VSRVTSRRIRRISFSRLRKKSHETATKDGKESEREQPRTIRAPIPSATNPSCADGRRKSFFRSLLGSPLPRRAALPDTRPIRHLPGCWFQRRPLRPRLPERQFSGGRRPRLAPRARTRRGRMGKLRVTHAEKRHLPHTGRCVVLLEEIPRLTDRRSRTGAPVERHASSIHARPD
jgi:hypothetical protein